MTFGLWIELAYAMVVLVLAGLAAAELRHRCQMRDCKCVACTIDRANPMFTTVELIVFLPIAFLCFIVVVGHVFEAMALSNAL